MNEFKKFIDTYKELEKECRDKNDDIKNIEEKLSEDDSNRLRMCRYFRNFIQHTKGYEKFLSITPDMQKFLEEQLNSYLLQDDVVKKHLTKSDNYICSLKDKYDDVILKFSKSKMNDIIVLDNGHVLGSVSLFDLIKEHSKTAKIKDVKKLNRNFTVVPSSCKMADIPDGLVICLEDDKFLGVVKK